MTPPSTYPEIARIAKRDIFNSRLHSAECTLTSARSTHKAAIPRSTGDSSGASNAAAIQGDKTYSPPAMIAPRARLVQNAELRSFSVTTSRWMRASLKPSSRTTLAIAVIARDKEKMPSSPGPRMRVSTA